MQTAVQTAVQTAQQTAEKTEVQTAMQTAVKTAVKTEFQSWFRASEGPQARMPPMTELITFLDLKYEQQNNQGSNRFHYKRWKIIYDIYDDEVEEENEA